MKKKLKEWKKKEDQLNQFDEWLHIGLVILFIFSLLFIPNFCIWSYNLSSDTWSFFF